MKQLDFIIVGAQKCATTTLYKYLNEHSQISMPKDKEAPFFNVPANEQDYDAFLEQTFQQALPGQKLGKASPQYMAHSDTPKRIKQLAPAVKIIAILKNPLERSFSHYKMAIRRGTENRDYQSTVNDGLNDLSLANGRARHAPSHSQGYESEADFYLSWSEYGRTLSHYYNQFPTDQIMVVFAEDLNKSPKQTLAAVLEFLAVDSTEMPDNLGQQFHKGSGRPMINPKRLRYLVNLPILKSLYKMIPEQSKTIYRYWFDQFNMRSSEVSKQLDDDTKRRLQCLFLKDYQILRGLGLNPPWQIALQDEHTESRG
jgi:hypothetical protein